MFCEFTQQMTNKIYGFSFGCHKIYYSIRTKPTSLHSVTMSGVNLNQPCVKNPRILRDNTKNNRFMYVHNDGKQYLPISKIKIIEV